MLRRQTLYGCAAASRGREPFQASAIRGCMRTCMDVCSWKDEGWTGNPDPCPKLLTSFLALASARLASFALPPADTHQSLLNRHMCATHCWVHDNRLRELLRDDLQRCQIRQPDEQGGRVPRGDARGGMQTGRTAAQAAGSVCRAAAPESRRG